MSLPVRRLAPAAALALGVVAVFAFSPFGIFPFMPLTLAALFWLAEDTRPRRAFLLGWLYGVGEFAFGVYWIYISVHLIGDAPIWLAVLMLAVLVAVMGVFSAAVLWAAAYIAPARGWRRYAVALPALWALLEWVRSWIASGFPWLAAGYSQIDSPLAGYGPLAGVFAIGWTVAVTAGLLVLILAPARALDDAVPVERRRRRVLALAALILLWTFGGWLSVVNWTHPAGAPLKVSLVQGNIPQTLKWNEAQFFRTLSRYRALTATQLGSDLVIWPETAVPDLFRYVAADYLYPIADQVVAHGGKLMLGIPAAAGGRNAYYNAIVLLGPGKPQFYYKHHLVPFGEYFPVPDWVRRWLKYMDLPYSSFAAGGANQPPLNLGKYKAAVSICYEDLFGAQIIRMLPAANFLINLSDDAWFGNSIALPQHLEISRMRALETGRFALRATNTGITAVIGPHGKVRKRLPIDRAGVLKSEVTPYAGATPYVTAGNLPLVFALSAMLLGAIIAAAYQNRQKQKDAARPL